MFLAKFFLSTLLLCAVKSHPSKLEGQPCHHVGRNQTGTCKLLINCDSAVEEVQTRILPQICGLADTAPYVCCPKEPPGHKSHAKCLEYSKLNTGKCNILSEESLDVSDAVGKEFPHLAILGYRKPGQVSTRYFCSGALISERFVLTPAYCTTPYPYGVPKYVRLGDLDLRNSEDDADPQELKIEKILRHPDYVPDSDDQRVDDVALVKLERDVDFTPYVRPACLHVDALIISEDALLAAVWRSKEADGEELQKVQKLPMRFVGLEECQKGFPVKWERMTCATSEHDGCIGVPGDILQTVHEEVKCMYDVVGLFTAGTCQPCYHATKNLNGTCTLLINCDSAFQEVQKQVLPQICGLGRTAPIVCCPNLKPGDKALAKCLEYSKLRRGKCNIQLNRSVNLTDAVGKEFPHMATLGYSGSAFKGRKYLCGGTLISERFVLTTAQCAITDSEVQPKYVRLGDLNLQENEDDAEPQEFKIEKIIFHPGYTQAETHNDIVLIKLNRDVEFTPYVFPACLHVEQKLDTNGKLLNAGWADDESRHMRRILLEVVGQERCRKEYWTNGKWPESSVVDELMICAESKIPSCYEPGGSLQTVRRDADCMYDMVGMLAFGKECGVHAFPYVFVRISHYVDWIEKIVWP